MSKKDKDEITFNKKVDDILDSEDVESLYDNNNDDQEEYENNKIDENYEQDTLILVENEIIEYVKKTGVPLCEYINTKSIDKFFDKIKI